MSLCCTISLCAFKVLNGPSKSCFPHGQCARFERISQPEIGVGWDGHPMVHILQVHTASQRFLPAWLQFDMLAMKVFGSDVSQSQVSSSHALLEDSRCLFQHLLPRQNDNVVALNLKLKIFLLCGCGW